MSSLNTDRKNKALSKKERTAVIVAALVVVAVVVACGLALSGWLQGSSSPEAASSLSSASSAQMSSSPARTNEEQSDGEDSAAKEGAQSDEGTANGATDEGSHENADDESGSSESSSQGGGSSSSEGSSGGSSPGGSDSGGARATITVSISVDSSAAHAYNSSYAASMGSGTVTLKEGASVYDALVALGVTIAGDSTYVRSINGLAEFDCGKNSGWLYYVNGSRPSASCGRYKLSGGESIVWLYTVDYTKNG